MKCIEILASKLTTSNLEPQIAAKLLYAGAHNPLWIIRKGSSEIEEIKANKQSIGKMNNPEPYLTRIIHCVDKSKNQFC